MSDEQFSAENADGAVDYLDANKSEQGPGTGRGLGTGDELAGATAHREQLFEHGMVTVREGVRAAWLTYDG